MSSKCALKLRSHLPILRKTNKIIAEATFYRQMKQKIAWERSTMKALKELQMS
jgi:hypothetical protein